MTFFDSWKFRSNTPTFNPGDEITLYGTGYDDCDDELLARVGDTLLRIDGGSPELVDHKLRVTVTEFGEETMTGRADLEGVLEGEQF